MSLKATDIIKPGIELDLGFDDSSIMLHTTARVTGVSHDGGGVLVTIEDGGELFIADEHRSSIEPDPDVDGAYHLFVAGAHITFECDPSPHWSRRGGHNDRQDPMTTDPP